MIQFSKTTIYRKLFGVFLLIVIGIAAFLFFSYQVFSSSLEMERKAQSKNLSEVGINIIQYYYDLSSSGEMSASAARELAFKTLESAVFEDYGYFWINSGEGHLLMQPYTPERVGINQINWTDSKGQYVFRNFISTAKSGGGWVTYRWPKPDSREEYPKISYVAYFEPWNLVLGTGVYLDDLQNQVSQAISRATGILITCFLIFVSLSVLLVNHLVRQLETQAVKDPLTNLYTKRFLNEIVPSLLSKHQRDKNSLLVIIFIDIDHFKKINDQYGHKFGDVVLTKVAYEIVNSVRPNDFCIRYGGEEFLVVGQFRNEEPVGDFADRIRQNVSELVFFSRKDKIQVTISAGIAVRKDLEEPFDDTIRRADEKLYHSKNSGRNMVSM